MLTLIEPAQLEAGVQLASITGILGVSLAICHELFVRQRTSAVPAWRWGTEPAAEPSIQLRVKPEAEVATPVRSKSRHWYDPARVVALAVITPVLEKNVLKTLTLEVPIVFSMSRLVVLAFSAAMIRQVWHAGVAGWPDATLAIATVLALPLLGALDRVAPEKVVDVATALIGRFGVGDTRRVMSVYAGASREPSKLDNHVGD